MNSKRTDLALDAAEMLAGSAAPIKNENYTLHNIPTYKIIIDSEQSVKSLSKPLGTYITFQLSRSWYNSKNEALNAAHALRDELIKMVPKDGTILVVGLGNINITADNIGPKVSHKIIVTRHLKSDMPESFLDFHSVSAIAPGVLGLTGIETGEIIKGVCDKISPDAIIAIDALATSELTRLCSAVQLSDSGITPGSGVGNFRFALNKETLGIPVIAIGIPTVVEAGDLLDGLLNNSGIENVSLSDDMPMVVTPKDIDVLSDKSALLISTAINLALHSKIDEEELLEFMA